MKKCFVISRIGSKNTDERKKADQVLKHLIKPCFNEEEYEVVRADQESSPNQISKAIIKNIIEADIVVADLTGYNPNVFYELAVRHTIGKPVIQLIEEKNDIPFDISNVRTIFYNLDLDGVERAKSDLKKFIQSAIDNPESDNPVTDILKLSNISTINSEDISVDQAIVELADEIKRIPTYLSDLEIKMSGRIAQIMDSNNSSNSMSSMITDSMTTDQKMGLVAMEKMLSNPQISAKIFEHLMQNEIK